MPDVEVMVARLVLSQDEAGLCDAVGLATFVRAGEHVAADDVVEVTWDPATGTARGRVRREVATGLPTGRHTTGDAVAGHGAGWAGGESDAALREVFASMIVAPDGAGALSVIDSSCGCRQPAPCAHAAALVLATMPWSRRPGCQASPVTEDLRRRRWEDALSTLLPEEGDPVLKPAAEGEAAEIGLQFELVAAASPSWMNRIAGAGNAAEAPVPRVALRPVVPGRAGWVRGRVSWTTLGYYATTSARARRHRQLLDEILALSMAGGHRYAITYHYNAAATSVYLDGFTSRRVWDLLAEAQEAGLPLVQAGPRGGRVEVGRDPAGIAVRVTRDQDGLVLTPVLMVGGHAAAVAPGGPILIGEPPHGVVWWGAHDAPDALPGDRVLWLAPLANPLPADPAGVLTAAPIHIPAPDERRFLEHTYPRLLRQVAVVAADAAVELPEVGPPALNLTVDPLPGHALRLHWRWSTPVGGQSQIEPLWTPGLTAHVERRQHLLRRAAEILGKPTPGLLEQSPTGQRLVERATLTGDAVIRFVSDVLPRLSELDGVEVVLTGETSGLDYRETYEAPVIAFTTAETGAAHDWFDLAVQVSVGSELVSFNELFLALANDQQYLILPSGRYFGLDRAEYRQLHELIVESRSLQDAPPGVVRVGRFQAGLWQDLADLGEITGQAAAWQRSLRSLTERGATRHRPPRVLRATLRPYQREGFGWLAALYEHRLGGVLADDMGLGKTLQALALVCHARGRSAGESAPFLVVAPASVVHNWAGEAARFTPRLTVRTITQTRARRGADLADVAAGADIVVTSYALFRLEYDGYQALAWSGLVLDEAQFVKNPASQAHRCAKRLPVQFKLAITGTPLENNLAELWALCSITAPGLFPGLDRFTAYYRQPIEKGHDTERLAQLRRRIRPLMLRRGKADVLADLPDKQEQVLELELNPRHRRLYQAYLQRERQKVLGLLGELEKNRFQIFRSLTLLRQASLDVALVDSKHRGVPSTKLEALVEQVTNLVAEGHRSLVFSQFTRFLTAARQRLERAGIDCCYLDGKTRDRPAVLAEFKNGTAPVMLISLKAGGFGLNLTEADYCLLLDPWWNPATEAQAVDRVHRIGQTRHVMVYRLVAKDTIEEKVMALKARKAELFTSVLNGDEFSSARLTAADVEALLE